MRCNGLNLKDCIGKKYLYITNHKNHETTKCYPFSPGEIWEINEWKNFNVKFWKIKGMRIYPVNKNTWDERYFRLREMHLKLFTNIFGYYFYDTLEELKEVHFGDLL